MRFRVAALLLAVLVFIPVSVLAASDDPAPPDQTNHLLTRNPFMPVPPLEPTLRRPMMLPALYVSFAGLQAYDGYTTTAGVRRGALESNPIVGGLAGNPAAFWAVKGAVTVGSIYVAEQLWRQRRRAQAIAVMIVSNGLMAAVAARNNSVTRRLR